MYPFQVIFILDFAVLSTVIPQMLPRADIYISGGTYIIHYHTGCYAAFVCNIRNINLNACSLKWKSDVYCVGHGCTLFSLIYPVLAHC